MTKEVAQPPPTEVGGLGRRAVHAWFSPKRRGKILLGEIAETIENLMNEIASEKGISLLACRTSYDHMHLLISPPDSQTVSESMRLLKGVSARRVFQRFPELKLDIGHNNFWQRGYGYRPIPDDQIDVVRSYILSHASDANHAEPRTSVRGR
jgi:putative transposase